MRQELQRLGTQDLAVSVADRASDFELDVNRRCGHLVSTAEPRITAHSAGANRRLAAGRRGTVGMRRKSRKLLRQVLLAARRAIQLVGLSGTPQQLLKLGPAVFTFVFKDR